MKTFSIGWLNKCRCGNKSHTVKTARGNETSLWDDDAVKCNSCGREGVIQVCEDQARVLWETDEEMSERKPMTFTQEQLIEQATKNLSTHRTAINHPLAAIDAELFRIALSGMEAEPVAYADLQSFDNFKSMGGKNAACTKYWMWRDSGDGLIPVYTAPQPLTTSERAELENYRNAQQVVPDEREAFNAWNNETDCPLAGRGVLTAAWLAWRQRAAKQSGAVKDGWVMVPVEPTAEMISAGIAAHYERAKIQIHDRPAPGPIECAYVAMVAAAAQQEAK